MLVSFNGQGQSSEAVRPAGGSPKSDPCYHQRPMAASRKSAAPHRRYNPLTDSWILVSPHRIRRPWRGQMEPRAEPSRLSLDPSCYLCPGNVRAGGDRNPRYRNTFVFDNDFAALRPDAGGSPLRLPPLLEAIPERGICRVVCFTPRHDLSLAQMAVPEIRRVVDAWILQQRRLARKSFVRYVQIFENKGPMMGCSNPHPHGQIFAQESVPHLIARELLNQEGYGNRVGSCLLCDYLGIELQSRDRLVCRNSDFAVVVPFWAEWPYETLLLSRNHRMRLTELSRRERSSLASILSEITIRYDNLFRISFPYSMGWHQAPDDGRDYPFAHLHAHFYPPLLRSATIRKFMVGYEMLAEPQRDITPEASALRLRRQSAERFR